MQKISQHLYTFELTSKCQCEEFIECDADVNADVVLWSVWEANNFLRSSKLVSRVGSALGRAGVPYAGQIAGIAGKLGYGRKSVRRHRGGSLRLAGGIRM